MTTYNNTKEKKKKKKKVQLTNNKSYDFSIPYEFYKTQFGKDNEYIDIQVLNVSVGNLLKDFKIFEDLNNVQTWPISTLIQRELDHQRANRICHDYLLQNNSTKYFPALIAVLIPTDDEYKPLNKYGAVEQDELNQIKIQYVNGNEFYNEHEELIGLSEGISIIPFTDEEGSVIWNKNTVSAVIIDGQHRYKALQKAKEKDKSFENCKVTITLVDLTRICEKTNLSPTDVARDFFVTINNTPVDIDETRIVLMDDKDVLSTFTQVLIDDSLEDEKPGIPPMLIDWECEGAKHNATNSLTGVLVIRQIILSAMFDDSKVSSVDDRVNVRNIRKWKKQIELWMSPDEQIESKLGLDETIQHRFTIAEGQFHDDLDDDEEESIFLFSYSSAVSKLLKKRFQTLFLSSFRLMFTNLYPYEKIHSLANKHGVLSPDKPLNNFYRSFKGKRKLLKKDADIKNAVSAYEKEFSTLTEKSIPYTVMGQKSIFKALFDGFLSQAENKDNDEYLNLTQEFIDGFNEMYLLLCPSSNSDENFFLTNYKMRKGKISKAKSVGSEFWKGIIIKYNGEIDYSKTAISIFSQVIQDIIFFFYETESNGDEVEKNNTFEFRDYTKLISRHERLIKKLEFEEELGDDEIFKLAEKVVKSKQKYLNELLSVN